MNQTATATTVITQSQLADLAGLHPSFVSVHLDELPESFFLRDGSNGRPPRCFEASRIIEFVLAKTEALTELECRLRVALLNHESRNHRGQPRLIDEDGVCHVLPSDLRDITSEERDLLRRTIDRDRQALRTKRAKRIAAHTPNDTEE